MSQKKEMERQGRIWLKARNIIARALADMRVHGIADQPTKRDEDNAAAIMARLAAEGLLIATPEELK